MKIEFFIKTKKYLSKAILLIVFFGFFNFVKTENAKAAPSRVLGFQGTLSDINNAPLTGSYNFNIKIYNVSSGGSALFTETHNSASVQNGFFSLRLGSLVPFGSLDFNQDLFIGVSINATTEMSPRIPINAVSYSLLTEKTKGFEVLNLAPASPVVGQTYFDSTTNIFYGFNGSVWQSLSSSGTNTTNLSQLTVNGTTALSGNNTLNGTTTIGSSLYITASSTFSGLSTFTGTAVFVGNASFNQGISVGGTVSSSGISASYGSFTSFTTLNLSVPTFTTGSITTTGTNASTGLAFIFGTGISLNVINGVISALASNTINTGSLTSTGTNASSGLASLYAQFINSYTSGTDTVGGILGTFGSFTSLNANTSLIGALNVGSITTTGTGTFGGLSSPFLSSSAINSTGTITSVGLNITNFLQATTLNASGPTTLQSTLTTQGLATLNGGFIANGSSTVVGNFTGAGTGQFTNLYISGSSTIVGTASFSGGLSVGSYTPAVTTNMLYGSGGNLYYNGSQVGALSGTQGQVAYFSGANTAVGTSSLFIAPSGNIGIGTTTATGRIAIQTSGSAGNYTPSNSGIFMYNASGTETFRIVATDPDSSNWNSSNLFIGRQSGMYHPTDNTSAGYYNLGLGEATLRYNTTGSNNTAINTFSLASNTTGFLNTAIGGSSLFANTSGSSNVAIGDSALVANTSGSTNVAVGIFGLSTNTTGSNNTWLGSSVNTSGPTTGSQNLILGSHPTNSINLTTGNRNIIIGYDNGLSSSTSDNQLNIGNLIWGTGVNNTTGSNIAGGNIGIGTITPTARFAITGSSSASIPSFTIGSSTAGYQFTVANSGNISIGTTTTPNYKLTVAGTIAPSVDNTYDLGSPTNQFKSLYVGSNTIYIGGVSLGAQTPGVLNWSGSAINVSSGTASAANLYASSKLLVGTTAPSSSYAFNLQGQTQLWGSSNSSILDIKTLTTASTSTPLMRFYGINNGALTTNPIEFRGNGSSNLGIGANALLSNVSGSGNIALNSNALQSNTTGNVNIAIGSAALSSNTTGNDNIAIGNTPNAGGVSTLASNTTGSVNIAIGNGSMQANTTGSNNIGIGLSPLRSNTSGGSNIAIGNTSLYSNTTGGSNVAVGIIALFNNTTGNDNTAVGNGSLTSSTTANSNSAFGNSALNLTTTGFNNVGLGVQALYGNYTGSNNVAIGRSAMLSINGTNSVAIGSGAAAPAGAFQGVQNFTAVGYNALNNIQNTGDGNSVFGYQAGYNITTGANNTILGTNFATTGGISTGSNNILIGNDVRYNLGTTTSGQLNIGNIIFGTNVGSGTILSSGNIGIGTNTPALKLSVHDSAVEGPLFALADTDGYCTQDPDAGTIVTACSSDERLKKDITDYANSLDELMKFKIRDYTVKASGNRMTGVIAQEVLQTAPDMVAEGIDGYLTVQQINTWKLVKGIQELNKKTDLSLSAVANKYLSADPIKEGNIVIADLSKDQFSIKLNDTNTTNPVPFGVITDWTTSIKTYFETTTSLPYLLPVQTAGQAWIQIAQDSQTIKYGDKITVSQTNPGQATKAINSTFIIGQALQIKEDKVLIEIKPEYHTQSVSEVLQASGINETDYLNAKTIDKLVVINKALFLSDVEIKGVLKAKSVEVEEKICIKDICVDYDKLKLLLETAALPITSPAAPQVIEAISNTGTNSTPNTVVIPPVIETSSTTNTSETAVPAESPPASASEPVAQTPQPSTVPETAPQPITPPSPEAPVSTTIE